MHKGLLKTCLSAGLLFGLAANCQAENTVPDTYRAQMLSFNCFTCHGPNGHSTGRIPSLNKLSTDVIRDKMFAFKNDKLEASIMDRIAKGYSDKEIAIIADYIAGLD